MTRKTNGQKKWIYRQQIDRKTREINRPKRLTEKQIEC